MDLSLVLAKRVILDRVSFKIACGESVALVGPNGSGKTSILRCLLGLVPFTGRALIDGHDVIRDPVKAKTLLGYLPQKPSFGNGTAREILTFVAELRRIPAARVESALETVGLKGDAGHEARTFSGGMQQRLSFAMALLTEAPILLLDEPTASLDREGQSTFLEIARELKRQGRTLLLASHRSDEIARIADRVIRLENGALFEATLEADAANVRPLALGGLR